MKRAGIINPATDCIYMNKYCKCCKDDVCDFCLHFLFYRDKKGMNIDGSGWCGLKRKEVYAGDGCKNYYCKAQWKKDMKKLYTK